MEDATAFAKQDKKRDTTITFNSNNNNNNKDFVYIGITLIYNNNKRINTPYGYYR